VECNVGEPQVAYREAITAPATIDYTHKKQSGGSGQFAKVQIEFSPLEADGDSVGDFEFESNIKGGAIPKEYIPGVQKGIDSVLANGVLAGFPVTGIKANLIDGSYHDVDSSVMAFEIAGRQATREGLRKCRPKLKEPIMKVDVISPEEFLGEVIGDINSRRGVIQELGERGSYKTVCAKIPLSNMFQYVSSLRSMSKGRAQYSMVFDSYDFVPGEVEKEITAKFKPKGGGEELAAQSREGGASALASVLGLFAGSGVVFAVLSRGRLFHPIDVNREPLLTVTG